MTLKEDDDMAVDNSARKRGAWLRTIDGGEAPPTREVGGAPEPSGDEAFAEDCPQLRGRAGTGPWELWEELPGPVAGVEVTSFSDAFVEILAELGIEHAYGISGGAIVPFYDALSRSQLSVIHCRHEAGAAFAALEDSLASGRPTVVFTTTGPGITNALTGLVAARWEGAKVLFISAATPLAQTGRGAFQDTSFHTLPVGLFTAGSVFDYVETVAAPEQLARVARRLETGLAKVGGFVAHVSVPTDLQRAEVTRDRGVRRGSLMRMGCDPEAVASIAQELRDTSAGPTAIWVGFGARSAAPQIRALAERLGAAVMSSPRGKGVFPESHPQFIGVTGFAGHSHVKSWIERHRPQRVLVLGTRLGEFTTFWDPRMVPDQGFIHVDIDPDAGGEAYPLAYTRTVQAEIGAFVRALLEQLDDHVPSAMPGRGYLGPQRLDPIEDRRVRPTFLMQCVQDGVVDAGARVMTEAGNAFAWGNHLLRFDEPNRYRVSTGFGSMGHAVTGVIGAALAEPGRKAVAIAGDGAMLMNSEISTAVQYGLPAVWIVLNDSQYGMIDHGMRHGGYAPESVSMPSTDFVAIARAMGADGVAVRDESELAAALEQAMRAEKPFVVDVHIDPNQRAPFLERADGLFKAKPWQGPPRA